MTILPTLSTTVDAVVLDLEDGQRTVLRSPAEALRLRAIATLAVNRLEQLAQDAGIRRDKDVALAMNQANRSRHNGHPVFANMVPPQPSRVVPIEACGCGRTETCFVCDPQVRA